MFRLIVTDWCSVLHGAERQVLSGKFSLRLARLVQETLLGVNTPLYSQATVDSQGVLAVQPQHTRGLLLCDNVSSGILELAVTRSRSCVDKKDMKTKEV